MPPVTVDLILENLQTWVTEKQPIDVSTWLDAAQKLTVLISDVQGELFDLQRKNSEKKLELMDQGKSGAYAKTFVESTEDYVREQKLEAKIDQVTELIRISKLQARMSSDNQKNY